MMHAAPLARWLRAALFALVWPLTATASPFVPGDDGAVLERLPARAAQARMLARQVAMVGNDPVRAAALAESYYRLGRHDGDPRFLGYAQALLRPWWPDPAPPTPVLVARATLKQALHDFDAALADLDRAIDREPGHAQALLLRATIRTLQARYAGARDDCLRLAGRASGFHAVACEAAIDAVTGRAARAVAALEHALPLLPARETASRAWGESLLGEIRHRQDDPAAERHFRRALAADPRDVYTLAVYADWLLDQHRYAEVIDLLADATRVDALLLRLTLAQKALGRAEAVAHVAMLNARFAASRARGDVTHRREEARFALHVLGDAAAALALAHAHWQVQHEPADLRILAEAGAAANDDRTRRLVRAWLERTGLEDVAIAALATSAAGTP